MLGLRHDIPEILKAIDLCVLPTLQESLPQALLQAMAMEKPVIGTDVGGVGEAVKDGINGRLVRPGSSSCSCQCDHRDFAGQGDGTENGQRGTEDRREELYCRSDVQKNV